MIFRIVLIVILGFLVLTGIQKIIFGYFKKRLLSIVEEKFAGREILMMALNANFFGQKTRGKGQVRGNGALVLTNDELWFCLAAPKREISIPINSITELKLKRSHLGKSVFKQLLAVSFNYRGQQEQIAWYVADVNKWKDAIEGLRKI